MQRASLLSALAFLFAGCSMNHWPKAIPREMVAETSLMPCEFIGIGHDDQKRPLAYFWIYYGKSFDLRNNDEKNWGEMAVPVENLTLTVNAETESTPMIKGCQTLFYNTPDFMWQSAVISFPNEKAKCEFKAKL